MEENLTLKELKKEFDTLYQRSLDKEAFLKKEIEGYSKIFDENQLKLPVLSTEDEPLLRYDILFSSMRIFLVREFYDHFIVKGADISDLEEKEQIDFSSWIREHYDFAEKELYEPSGPKYYYTLARDLNEYLKWLQNKLVDYGKSANVNETIIDSLYLTLIFKKYGHYFENETLDSWLARFSKELIEKNPIKLEPDAKPGTVRLKLIAILASIHKTTNNGINFETFVKTNFGILRFESAKSRSKKKAEFIEIVKDCDKILKIMT